jgi:hypothetical protein
MRLLGRLVKLSEVLRQWDYGWSVHLRIDKDGPKIHLCDSDDDYEGNAMRQILEGIQKEWRDTYRNLPKPREVNDYDRYDLCEQRKNIKATLGEVKRRLAKLR